MIATAPVARECSRELKNAVERLAITVARREPPAASPRILHSRFRSGSSSLPPPARAVSAKKWEKVEKAVIEAALKEFGGEINATFQSLGISRRALYERMKKYGLDRQSFR